MEALWQVIHTHGDRDYAVVMEHLRCWFHSFTSSVFVWAGTPDMGQRPVPWQIIESMTMAPNTTCMEQTQHPMASYNHIPRLNSMVWTLGSFECPILSLSGASACHRSHEDKLRGD